MLAKTDLRGRSIAAALAAVLVAAPAARAGIPLAPKPVQICAGIYGIYGIPVIQQDAAKGSLYGAKAKVLLMGPLGAEASYTRYNEGDVEWTERGQPQTLKGGTQSVLALNAILKGPGLMGLGMYFTGGLGSYTLKKDTRPDLKRTGYNGGLGFEFRAPMGIAVEASGRLHVVPLDGGGGRKFAALQIGVNYYIL